MFRRAILRVSVQALEKLKANFAFRKRNFSFRGLTVRPRNGKFLSRNVKSLRLFQSQDKLDNSPTDSFSLSMRLRPTIRGQRSTNSVDVYLQNKMI